MTPYFPLPDDEQVYAYIQRYARHPTNEWPTSRVFYELMVNRQVVDYQRDKRVIDSLDNVVKGLDFQGERGQLFMNRCVHTAVNPLHLDAIRQDDLKELVQRLRSCPDGGEHRTTRRMRKALNLYTSDQKFKCILRQAKLIEDGETEKAPILADLYPEYSFLYVPGGISKDIEKLRGQDNTAQTRTYDELTRGLRHRKKQKIYRTRTALKEFHDRCENKTVLAKHNPTRLTQKELREAIFLYNTRRSNSFRERGAAFSNSHRPDKSFGQCRDEVMTYILQPLHGRSIPQPNAYGIFKQLFHRALIKMHEVQGVMQSTVIQIFKKILAVLLPNGTQQNHEHRQLRRYVLALDPSNFAALLLNLVLGCPMVLYELEQRLTALFIAYEQEDLLGVSWLIKFFEYMHLALTMNYRYLHTHPIVEENLIPASIIIL